MLNRDPDDIERRLRDGEWLPISLVAIILKVDKNTVAARGADGTIELVTKSASRRGDRYANPADVLRLLEEDRRKRGDVDQPPTEPPRKR